MIAGKRGWLLALVPVVAALSAWLGHASGPIHRPGAAVTATRASAGGTLAGPVAGGELAGPAAGGELAGSAACADCHAAEWRQWRSSAHYRTIDEAGPDTVRGRFGSVEAPGTARISGPTWPQPAGGGPREVEVTLLESDGRHYAVFEEPDAFIESNFQPSDSGRYSFPLDYTLGKLFYQTYMTRMPNGEIYVTPVMWEIEEERWRLAGWRPFGTDCAHCHVTGLGLQSTPEGSAGPSPWSRPDRWVALPVSWEEMSVGCEVCHGPGATHVADPRPDNIDNPARRDNRARADLCGTCHGMGVANAQTHRLGDPVRPPMTTAEVPSGWRINAFWPTDQHKTYFTMYQGHLRSAHWRRARLSCAPCHPAHAGGTRYPVEDDSQCTLCHTGFKRRLTAHTHHPEDGPGSRCVACHMPRNNRFTLVPGVVLMTHVRSHDITIPDPRRARDHGVPDACGQCHAEEGPEWALERMRELWPETSEPGER